MCGHNVWGESRTQKNVRMENRLKVLYLWLLKALYGCMEYVLVCYDLYIFVLKYYRFIINPYDRFTANSVMIDKQYTIAWYVYGNMLSHIE